MDTTDLITIDDVRRRARRKLPKMVLDFVEGGAEEELTLARNRAGFGDIVLQPRYLVDVSERDLATTILGSEAASPVLISSTGLNRLAHPEGELAVARAAAGEGSIFIVGVFSSYTIEEIRAASAGPLWFQIYLWKDRGVTRDLVERARQAGYEALCLTVDVPVLGLRERDLRNGMTIPVKVSVRGALDVARRPRWLYRLARDSAPTFASMRGIEGAGGDSGMPLISYVNRELFDPSQSWADLEWLRELWDGKLVVKGILHPDDARRATELGADGIMVSNHGGRQLDGVAGTVAALPRVVDAVGDRAEVILDGGIRRGSDIVKALALGARGCGVGRPYWWGLAAGGEPGVRRVLEILNTETDRVMALVGKPRLADLDSSVLLAA
ncbi:MAG TPA: alpha-hydroxy acid oxidase [Solirubrobacterales bacterium]|jgi:L-lactate dehydrogenase (cytochrome)|nr:alpha-hydroxy acid oxidase [Solirubrobacterales bacterium]